MLGGASWYLGTLVPWYLGSWLIYGAIPAHNINSCNISDYRDVTSGARTD